MAQREQRDGRRHTDRVALHDLSAIGLSLPSHDDPTAADTLASTLRWATRHGVDWVLTGPAEGLAPAVLRSYRLAPLVVTRIGVVRDLSNPKARPQRILLPDVLRRSVEATLERLGVERLDAVLLDGPDEMGVPLETSWEALAELRESGVVRAAGLAGYGLDDVARCHDLAAVDLAALELPAQRTELPLPPGWRRSGGPPVISIVRRRGLLGEAATAARRALRASTAAPLRAVRLARKEDRRFGADGRVDGPALVSWARGAGVTAVAVPASTPRELLPWLEQTKGVEEQVA
jgi:aryl-alcohol dehydrogenase-like predicted oxidoreductase